MGLARKYIIIKTTDGLDTQFNMTDAFLTYPAISVLDLSYLSNTDYNSRLTDFISFIGVNNLTKINELLNTGQYDEVACGTPTTTTAAPTTTTTAAPTTTTTVAPLPTFGFINGGTANMISIDGGTTWTLDSPNIGSYGAIAVTPTTIVAVRTSDGLNNVVDSQVRRSTDGGATWTEPTFGTPLAINESFGAISTKDINNIYVGNFSNAHVWFLYKSTDGGVTFNRTTTDIPFTGFGGVAALDALGDLVVAHFNQVVALYISTDGGVTWIDRTTAYNPTLGVSLSAISIADSNTIYISQLSTLRKSINAGATWSVITLPFSSRGVYFANANLGIISSFTNIPTSVAVTTNGGATWTTHILPIGVDAEINQVGRPHIIDENTWFATAYNLASSKQWLYKTTDGGTNISREEIPFQQVNNFTFI